MSLLSRIEALLRKEFRRTPFHNLFYLGYRPRNKGDLGGTCSDKVLAFKVRLDDVGIASRLHCGYIQGRYPHRLLHLKVDGEEYFADVGNGWPSIHLFPVNREIFYSAYGICFSSEITADFLSIYQVKQGKKTLSLEIPLLLRNEHSIMQEVSHRFDGKIDYPFSNGLRYAQIVEDEFIFLKNDAIRFYHNNGSVREIKLVDDLAVYQAIEKYFLIDLSLYGLRFTALKERADEKY